MANQGASSQRFHVFLPNNVAQQLSGCVLPETAQSSFHQSARSRVGAWPPAEANLAQRRRTCVEQGSARSLERVAFVIICALLEHRITKRDQ